MFKVDSAALSLQKTTSGGGCQSKAGVKGLASRCLSCPPPGRISGSSHEVNSRPANQDKFSYNTEAVACWSKVQ